MSLTCTESFNSPGLLPGFFKEKIIMCEREISKGMEAKSYVKKRVQLVPKLRSVLCFVTNLTFGSITSPGRNFPPCRHNVPLR